MQGPKISVSRSDSSSHYRLYLGVHEQVSDIFCTTQRSTICPYQEIEKIIELMDKAMEIENKFQQSDDHIQPAKNEPSNEEQYRAFIYIVLFS